MTSGFEKVRNICILKGMYVKNRWRPLQVPNIFNIYNDICNNNNSRDRKVYRLLNCKWKEWRHNLLLKSLDQQNYKYHLVGHNLRKDSHLNLKWGEEMVQELGSFVEGFGEPMTQTSTPKFVEEVVAELMKVNKVVELFQKPWQL